MKNLFLSIVILFVGQNLSAQKFTSVSLFSTNPAGNKFSNQIVHKGQAMVISKSELKKISESKPGLLELQIPFEGKIMVLQMEEYKPLSKAFQVTVVKDKGEQVWFPYDAGIFYKGKIAGAKNSFVAVSFFEDEMSAIVSDAESNIMIGALKPAGVATDNYLAYRNTDATLPFTIKCLNDEVADVSVTPQLRGLQTTNTNVVGCPVDIYVEADFALYQKNGSNVSNTVNMVATIMNGVSIVYANENISMQLREVKVWSTADPYSSENDAKILLKAFRADKASGFNGDLAHFMSGRTFNGGVNGLSVVGVLCDPDPGRRCGMSTVVNISVPTADVNTYILSHELGHNLGSLHTQNCSWIGGALDNCVPPEGTCSPGPAPVNGGTIMSYCAVNLANGFGKQPGDKIRAGVLAATCICTCKNMEVSVSQANINCDSKGTATAAVTGLTSTIDYLWDDGETAATANKLTAGWHYVTVQDHATTSCKIIKGVKISLTLPSTATPPKPAVTETNGTLSSSAQSGNQWMLNGVEINGATGSSFKPAADGDYTVQVTVNGCKSNTSDIYHFTNGTTPGLGGAVTIYPNPVIQDISVKNSEGRNLLVQLYNMLGQELVFTSGNQGVILVKMNTYPAGGYILLVSDVDSDQKFRKLVIKK